MGLLLSQTLVKDLEREEACPFKWKEQWIEKNPLLKLQSDDLDRGKYFEWLAIGGGAIAGEDVVDLPRLATGKKSIDQLRIEQQAERCKRMLFDPTDKEYLGFRLVSTQLELRVDDERGTADITAHDANNDIWILDLKLTKDLSSDRTKYGWGNAWEELDLLQQIHYEDLYEKQYGIRPKMGLLVFDYTPQMRVEFGEIIISNLRRENKKLRFDAVREVIKQYERTEWIKYPSVKECSKCSLVCKDRTEISKLVKKVINY